MSLDNSDDISSKFRIESLDPGVRWAFPDEDRSLFIRPSELVSFDFLGNLTVLVLLFYSLNSIVVSFNIRPLLFNLVPELVLTNKPKFEQC